MKKIILILILLVGLNNIQGFSQCTSLVFNQVLMLQTPAVDATVTYTVPAGKVWKIEGVMICDDTKVCGSGGAGQIEWRISRVNGVRVGGANSTSPYITELGCGATGAVTMGSGFPKWMGAGNSIELVTTDEVVVCASTVPYNFLSVIEFNCN